MLGDLVSSSNVCSLPWIHTEIDLQSHTIKPCCKYNVIAGHISETFPIVWFDKLADLRKKFINNDPIPECSACEVPDNAFSYKKWKNKIYDNAGFLNTNENNIELPKIFHITLKNTCNLACRMCYPNNSTKLDKLIKKSEILMKLYSPADTPRISIESLKGSFVNARHITIVGGEPLIDKDCIKLIEMVKCESPNLRSVTFSSNFVKLNYSLLEQLSNLDAKIQFNISLDGTKSIHEYIRYGCNWENIIKNIIFVKANYPKIKFAINSTISALNVGYVVEMLTTFHELEIELGVKFTGHMSSPVLDPAYLHPGILPDNIKQLYLEKLKSVDVSKFTIPESANMIPTAISLLNTESDKLPLFKVFIDEFDKIAGTNLRLTYPEFNNI